MTDRERYQAWVEQMIGEPLYVPQTYIGSDAIVVETLNKLGQPFRTWEVVS